MDLGLPSGTLWLDRLVGAPTPHDAGLYYQWGAVNGYTATSEYSFDNVTYTEQGLNTINSDLSENQDAAQAFYGKSAKMPSEAQVEELFEYTSWQADEQLNLVRVTSLINGASIILYKGGYMSNRQLEGIGNLRVWLPVYVSDQSANCLFDNKTIHPNSRFRGLNVMAVHS